MRRAALASGALLVACATTGPGGAPAPAVPVTPMCTLLAETTALQAGPNPAVPIEGIVLMSERTDPTVDHGFVKFHGLARAAKGDPAVGFTADVFGISEVWSRNPFAASVQRAQVTPASRKVGGGTDLTGSAWNLRAQDATGSWSPIFDRGSANRGDEQDGPDAAAATVPQLMAVGDSRPQVFACAGGRTDDGAERTTWFIESIAPGAPSGARPGIRIVQDVLSGDDHFVPDQPGPLKGPHDPPSPRVSGPGDPIRRGSVQCALVQDRDDPASRQLHLLAIDGGTLYHALASDFGKATTGSGFAFDRFRAVTPWGDVGKAVGGGFGTVVSAAIVARAASVSVFFVAQSNGRYRLWHTVRFASGAWRPADEVLALSGDAPGGSVFAWKVAAGACPALGAADWTPQTTELLVALWGGPSGSEVVVIRVLTTPRQWTPSVNGIYSPLRSLGVLLPGDPSRDFQLRRVSVSARPFREDAVPAP